MPKIKLNQYIKKVLKLILPKFVIQKLKLLVEGSKIYLRKFLKQVLPVGWTEFVKKNAPADLDYNQQVKYFHSVRRKKYQKIKVNKGQFSITTTVWNTDPTYFIPFIESVVGLDNFSKAEWVILDNGSTAKETIAILSRIKKEYPNIKLIRVEENVGIINGNRLCLENASGEYIIPADSDDLIYPDALNIFSSYIDRFGASILYSDEDKLLTNGSYGYPYRKPEWDPVLFYHSCYIAHLCCFKRNLAVKYGAYTNTEANGCHDWDTFSKFYLNGETPQHVGEVLYSWRAHEGSTAANIDSKDYIQKSHRYLLQSYLNAKQLSDRFKIEYSPLFAKTPDWWFKRKRDGKLNLVICKGAESPDIESLFGSKRKSFGSIVVGKTLNEVKDRIDEDSLVFFQGADSVRINEDYFFEAKGIMELFPDTIGVGGRVVHGDEIIKSKVEIQNSEIKDLLKGKHKKDFGYFAQSLKPHTANAIHAENSVWSGKFIKEYISNLPKTQPIQQLTIGLNSFSMQKSYRVVFNPLMEIEL